MGSIATRKYRDKVADRPTEYTHGRRKLSIPVGGVAILEYSALEGISVQATISCSVVGEEAFDCLYADLSAAVTVRECHGGQSVMNSPISEELAGCRGRKLRTAI